MDYIEMAAIERQRIRDEANILPADKAANLWRMVAYYERAAPHIAADPQGHATRAARGQSVVSSLTTFVWR